MKTIIGTIQSCNIFLELLGNEEVVSFLADADIDCDGTGGNPHHDPCFQPHTRYQPDLCAEEVPYIVVPPVVLTQTKGKVLGSHCEVTNVRNGKSAVALVGDSGPTRKIGELSPVLAVLLGLDPNPNSGGTEDKIILYTIYVGRPAQVNGKTYPTQSA